MIGMGQMQSPEHQGHGTENLGDMREWTVFDVTNNRLLIRYDTMIDGEQYHCLFRGSEDAYAQNKEQIRARARACLKNKQFEEIEV
jgi:hypothetical protein